MIETAVQARGVSLSFGETKALIEALYAATDVGTWKLLRRDHRLTQADTAAVLETLIRGVLDRAEER